MANDDKTTEIIINARAYEVSGKTISYTEVINLAYDNKPPTGPNIVITVTYSKGEDGKQGTLTEKSDPVKVKKGMVFNVKATDRS